MTLTAGAALAAAERAAPLIDCLASHGFAVAETFFDRDLCRLLEVETAALATDPTAIDAGVGRDGGHVTDPSIRRARIRWLDGQTAAQKHFLAEAEYLRTAINQALFLGLFSFEAQFALTPSGGFYARHVDSFAGRRNRIVSLVAYLSPDWRQEDGGCLRIWPSEGAPSFIDIVPQCGTLVLMLSEEIPHEVLPCHRPRASIAGWFRVSTP